MSSTLDAASSIYHTDVLSTIVRSVDWKSLIRFYALDDTASDLVLPEIRRRLFALVSLFIPEDNVPKFFDILRDSDGLICGSTVRRVLLPYIPQDSGQQRKETPLPKDLNVLIASDRSELLFNFFEQLQYDYSVQMPNKLYSDVVTRLEVFRKQAPGGKVSVLFIAASYLP